MDTIIDEGGVHHVTSATNDANGVSTLHLEMHHALTSELAQQVMAMVEKMAVRMVEVWATS